MAGDAQLGRHRLGKVEASSLVRARERIAALRAMAAPARQEPPLQDRIAVVPVGVWSLGGHHPAQRLARRWLL
jgi:hypothetical protein